MQNIIIKRDIRPTLLETVDNGKSCPTEAAFVGTAEIDGKLKAYTFFSNASLYINRQQIEGEDWARFINAICDYANVSLQELTDALETMNKVNSAGHKEKVQERQKKLRQQEYGDR